MSTPDGIETAEWDVVQGLAVDVVNASDEHKAHHVRQLLDYLDVLEFKYGPLPSILATRADYLDADDPAREELLLRAQSIAAANDDAANQVYVAQSLAELYLEKGNLQNADHWLTRMRECLFARNDDDFSEYERLRALYRRAVISSASS